MITETGRGISVIGLGVENAVSRIPGTDEFNSA
jgi:hypothetical protein